MRAVGNFSKMYYPQIIADRFNTLIELTESEKEKLNFSDRAIYEIVNFRCYTDIGGHIDPFYQYYQNEAHFDKFISILIELEEVFLSTQFIRIKQILANLDFWNNQELEYKRESNIELFQILEEIDEKQLLWKLDDKIGKLFTNDFTGD